MHISARVSSRYGISLVDLGSKGGYVWVYPPREASVIEGREHLSYRVFNNNILRKPFCKYCGVHVSNELNSLTGKCERTPCPLFFYPDPENQIYR